MKAFLRGATLSALVVVSGCGDTAQTATVPPEMRAGSEGMKGHKMPAPKSPTIPKDMKGTPPAVPEPWDPFDSHAGKDSTGLPTLRYYTLPG